MPDSFSNHTTSLNSPACAAFVIAPDDTADLPQVTRAVYVGGQGDLVVTLVQGQTVTLTAIQPGAIYPIRCTQVLQSGTTATGLVGLY